MLLSLLLFESEFLHIVAISYTALVVNELIMVALEITKWHTYMVLSELGTAVVYFGSMAVLPAYFGECFETNISTYQHHPLPFHPSLEAPRVLAYFCNCRGSGS